MISNSLRTAPLTPSQQEGDNVNVHIPGIGFVKAKVLQRYPDGDLRVLHAGNTHIVRPSQVKGG
jgi:hypothetical protein